VVASAGVNGVDRVKVESAFCSATRAATLLFGSVLARNSGSEHQAGGQYEVVLHAGRGSGEQDKQDRPRGGPKER
jgi:hypothetical protein